MSNQPDPKITATVAKMLGEIEEATKQLPPKTIIRNSIVTPDGTEIVSATRHDFVEHVDKNGKAYAVAGGRSYLRRVGDYEDCVETSVRLYHGHEIVREVFTWGTRGPLGDQPVKRVKLCDMSLDYISTILDDGYNVWPIFTAEVKWRQSALARKMVRKDDIERLGTLLREEPQRDEYYMKLAMPIITGFNNNEYT